MRNIVVVVDKFPQLSETFISRQVVGMGSDVICRSVDKQMLSQLPLTDSSVIMLEENVPKPELLLHKYIQKLKRRVFNLSSYYWLPALHHKLEQNLIELKADVILAHFAPVAINCLSVCQRLGIPLIVHFHGYDATGELITPYYKKDLKSLFEYATTVVAVSTKMKGDLTQLGCPPEKIEIIPCGVPVDEFMPTKKSYSDTFNFLFVGRLIPVKAPVLLIKAFEFCADKNENTHLAIIGNGPLAEEVKKYVGESRHHQKISLLGAKPLSIVKYKLSESHAYVQHNITGTNGRTEGWPVSIAEACASGLPVIATAHAGIKDQILHGETGFLVPEGDVKGMGEYMLKLSRDPELCEQMGAKSRQNIESYGNFNMQLKHLTDLLMKSADTGKM